MSALKKILIVEDEGIVAFNLQQRLKQMGYDVIGLAESGSEGLALVEQHRPDLVLMDIHIKGELDGIGLADIMHRAHALPIIYLTAYSEDTTLARARQTRPYGYLIKPFSERELHATIQMALERHEVQVQLTHSQQMLQLALQAAHMSHLMVDRQARQVSLSDDAGLLAGIIEGPVISSDSFLACFAEGGASQLKALLDFPPRAGAPLRVVAQAADRAGAPARWFQMDVASDEDGNIRGIIQDVTAQEKARQRMLHINEELEQRVAERTADLRRQVKEIEAFSYTAAHDLKSPLRAIAGLSDVLVEDCGQNLGTDGATMLGHISDAAGQMGALIDALLKLSSLSRVPMHRQPVDLSRMALDIADQLAREYPDLHTRFSVVPSLMVDADPALIRSVLDNLLRNAWKFSSTTTEPTIDLRRDVRNGLVHYLVCDNGIGFDPGQAERLFEPFVRLHASSTFAGTGLGLNIAQRIVERHGGSMCADGRPGQGACIGFHLAEPA
ncbi:MAG: response regulator [Burkholderiaceae bacterium]